MDQRSDLKTGYQLLAPGDPVPWFHQRSTSNERYAFDTAAGRYIVMCFFGSASDPTARAALDAVAAHRAMFDDTNVCFFGVSQDPGDERQGRVSESMPGIRFFWDFDGTIGRAYGVLPRGQSPNGKITMIRIWLVIDPTLRVMAVFPFAPDGSERDALFSFLATLPPPALSSGMEMPPPILILPRVFEPSLCERLIAEYNSRGGEPSGYMTEVGGKTTLAFDSGHKTRRDAPILDDKLLTEIRLRFQRRIRPELLRIHFFDATRMERYIVAWYSADDSGHFKAHRDNTTKGTAHRRFAVTINLSDGYEGGDLRFPEYGSRAYRPPVGMALVFSCSLMHEVTPVTKGTRYAFLPFLYDDAAAKVRERNTSHLAPSLGLGAYKA